MTQPTRMQDQDFVQEYQKDRQSNKLYSNQFTNCLLNTISHLCTLAHFSLWNWNDFNGHLRSTMMVIRRIWLRRPLCSACRPLSPYTPAPAVSEPKHPLLGFFSLIASSRVVKTNDQVSFSFFLSCSISLFLFSWFACSIWCFPVVSSGLFELLACVRLNMWWFHPSDAFTIILQDLVKLANIWWI